MDQAAAIIDAVPLPCIVIDTDERIRAANMRAQNLLGDALVGRNYVSMLRHPGILDAIQGCLEHRSSRTSHYVGNDSFQGTKYRVSCEWINTVPEGGVLVSFQDVTDVEHAGQMRRDFVANVSHELRTPLTALIGFIETLRGPARDDMEARQRFLKIMDSEAARMNRLVGDLLSLSRVESEERVRPTTELSLREILESTIHSLRPLADEAGAVITQQLGTDDAKVTGDMDQLTQVFTNLIENAIKYGGQSVQVAVSLTYTAQDAAVRGPSVRVRIADTGPGIASIHLPRLTERFYRADSHRSRELGGTGLGLAIVKHIINRHRGRLRVESELGEGSVFTVILPCHDQGDVRD